MNSEDKDGRIIVSLTAPAYPTCAMYKKDDGTTAYAPISYIAVTRSGELRPIECGDGEWIFSDDIDNYMGISEIHKEPSWMTSSEFLSLHRFGYLY